MPSAKQIHRLIEQIKSTDPQKREDALVALLDLEVTPKTPEFLELLISCLSDESEVSRECVLWLIRRFRQEGASAIPRITQILLDPKETDSVRFLAAQTLAGFGEKGNEVLLASLKPGTLPLARIEAAKSIVRGSPLAVRAVPDLIEMLDSLDHDTFHASEDALREIGARAVPSLREARNDPAQIRSLRATYLLVRIDPTDREAIDRLLSRMDQCGDQIFHVLFSLDKVDSDLLKPATPTLIKLLKHKDEYVRGCSIELLAKMRPTPSGLVPTFVLMLNDDDWFVSCGAADALGEIGEASPEVIKALENAILHPKDDQDDLTTTAAATALGKFGPRAKSALPTLEKRLKKRGVTRDERDRIKIAIKAITKNSKSNIP